MLNCEGDLHIFPFDSPMCTFAIESGELQTNIHYTASLSGILRS